MQSYLYHDLYQSEDQHWWHMSKRKLVVDLIKQFKPVRHPQMLDVGCGAGRNLEEFAKLGKAVGLDSSRRAIKFCLKRGQNNVHLAKAEKTPFSPQSFDVITILDVLEHTDDKKTLQEMSRILKGKGLLILTVPALPILWSKWDEILHHRRRYTKQDLTKLLTLQGYKIIFSSYLYSFLLLPIIIVRFFKSLLSTHHYSSDFKLINPLLNLVLEMLVNLELNLVKKQLLPIGSSIVVVASKYAKG